MSDSIISFNAVEWYEDYTYKAEGESSSILLSLVHSYDWPGALARLSPHLTEAKAIGIQDRRIVLKLVHLILFLFLFESHNNQSIQPHSSSPSLFMDPINIALANNASIPVLKFLINTGLELLTKSLQWDLDVIHLFLNALLPK